MSARVAHISPLVANVGLLTLSLVRFSFRDCWILVDIATGICGKQGAPTPTTRWHSVLLRVDDADFYVWRLACRSKFDQIVRPQPGILAKRNLEPPTEAQQHDANVKSKQAHTLLDAAFVISGRVAHISLLFG